MISANLATSDLLKIIVFWNKGYDVIIPVDNTTKEIISRGSNYIAFCHPPPPPPPPPYYKKKKRKNDETEDTFFSDQNDNASNMNTDEYSSVPFDALCNQTNKSVAADIRVYLPIKDMCST